MLMLGWTMQRQEVELRGFIKVFRIPPGVILDRIKAKFKEEESILTISMPKSAKGISGVGIVEVKEEEVDKVTPKHITRTTSANIDQQVPERTGWVIDEVLSKKESTSATDQATDAKGEEIKDTKVEGMAGITKTVAHEEFLDKEETLIARKTEEEKMEKKEETNEADDAEKLGPKQNATDVVSEREETPGTDEEHTAEKATRKADTEADFEKAKNEDEPVRVMNGAELTKEPEGKGLSELKEQVEKQTSNDKVRYETPQDLENREAKKTFQADHLVPELQSGAEETGRTPENDQAQEAEKSEAKREEGKEVSEINDSSEEGKEKDDHVSEGTTQEEHKKKKMAGGSRRRKPCAPFATAGSALLVSLVVIVIHWIRSRKR